MNPIRLIIQSLFHYGKRNLVLALGFAISTAVLTGALIVGDSVQYSLQDIVTKRLGQITHIMDSEDRYFTDELAVSIENDSQIETCGILLEGGVAVADGGKKRLNNVRILGVDGSFEDMAINPAAYGNLEGDDVIVSSNLIERLGIEIGDEFLLRMKRSSLVPLNAPFVSDAENNVSARVRIKDVANEQELGTFNLRTSQTPPFNIFISKKRLQNLMEIGERSNVLLANAGELPASDFQEIVSMHLNPQDGGIRIREDRQKGYIDLQSDRVFIDPVIAESIISANLDAVPYLTYFVNSIHNGDLSTPYSFVSTLPDTVLSADQILITDWLAEDIGARAGDSIELTYYVVGLLRELEERTSRFTVKQIIPLAGAFVDPDLMPGIPGMSDAGNCRDWDTGVPIDLERIRDKDEDYWTEFKGTPKAYISAGVGTNLWENRFGRYTSIRFTDSTDIERIANLVREMDPGELGYEIRAVKSSALYAAANGIDFSELFGGLSFFLLAGAIIMTILIFRLSVEDRKEQVMILSALGFPARKITGLLIGEGSLVAVLGGLLGLGLSLLYNRLIFSALNNVWSDIVRTDMLTMHLTPGSLVIGFLASVLLALLVITLVTRSYLLRALRLKKKSAHSRRTISRRLTLRTGITILGMGFILILYQFTGNSGINATLFFLAGGLFLIAGLMLSHSYLKSEEARNIERFDLRSLSRKNAVTHINRSLAIIMLMALGTFIVISTGSNRKDLIADMENPESGTGGYLYYAESTIPVLKDLNDEAFRFEMGLTDGYEIIQMRISEGDDASCLNLNRITQPRILGTDPGNLKDRFSFITSTEYLHPTNPWESLNEKIAEDVIPAIADETVIKWGLGMEVGDTLLFQDARGEMMKLLLVGGTAPSIFQGSVIISEEHFLEHFPSSSGSNVFLVDGALKDTSRIEEELSLSMRDLGWSMELTGKRLSEFNSVTNTYLSIFLILGALGLLLGTIGLGTLISRSILERKAELGLMKAVGYSTGKIRSVVAREYIALFILGTAIGGISALVATLPAFISRNTEVSFVLILSILLILLLNGLLWIYGITGVVLRSKRIIPALRND